MAIDLRELTEQAQQLPLTQKLELIAILSNNIANDAQLQEASQSFWEPRTIQEHSQAHPVTPVVNVDELRSKAWPQTDRLDEFLNFLQDQRTTTLLEQ
ncbi:hypothetical protein [Synechococcus sp. PCC 7336]|uniref:hypothetical protein n=1 Tax=Synechococcus sp. PCC 7336 TaxID=195250 RepID=UPI000345C8BD|nr:hypothetical protein [Synechococcus sp. PCC 7336]